MRLCAQLPTFMLILAFSVLGCRKSNNNDLVLETKRSRSQTGLRKVAAKLTKEVEYRHAPMYSLLVFGADAEHQHWLVVDGNILYIDRNGNGDITDSEDMILIDQKATDKQPISASDEFLESGSFKVTELEGYDFELNVWFENPEFVPEANEDKWITDWRKQKKANGWLNSTLWRKNETTAVQTPVILSSSPMNVQITHIDGELTFDLKSGDRQCLDRGKKNTFDIHIGTQGESAHNCKTPAFARLATNEVPQHLVPVAEFEFCSKASADTETIIVTLNLDQRC